MKIFETSKKILLKVVNDNIPFTIALKVAFKNGNSDPSFKGNVAALVGCELRHHLIFDHLIKEYLGDVSLDKSVYARFYIANQLFLKRFVSKELLDMAYIDVDKKCMDDLVSFVNSTNEIIPNDLDKSSPEFLSYRFNTPSWVIRMWQKQFGNGLAYKMLKTNYHQSIPTIRVDTNKISMEEVTNKHPELIKNVVSNMLSYEGKGNPKRFDEFKGNKIFFMKMGTKFLLDQIPIKPYEKTVIYSDVPNNIYLELASRLGNELNLDLIINHTQSYYEAKRNIEENGIKGIDIFNTNAKNIITCVSNNVDLIMCLPNSTSLDLLRNTPDFFLRCKQDKIDSILEQQKVTLVEAGRVLNVGGQIVYMVPTLNKKESTFMIGAFLGENSNFELVAEKQMFPFEEMDSCLYYAILRKTKENND